MEKVSYYKNSWRIYLGNFAKLFGFTLSVMILFFASVTLFFLLSSFDLGISSLLLLAFGVVPLFFSLQVIIAKVSNGREVSYNEFYSSYKVYFNPINKGSYGVIRNIILTIIIYYLSIYLSLVVYDLFNTGVLDELFSLIDINDVSSYYSVIINVLDLDGYIYYLIVSMVFPFLFFFERIKKRLMVPYFNMVFPVPNFLCQSKNKMLYREYGKQIRKHSFSGNLIFALCFMVGFISVGIISLNFVSNITIIVILSLFGGILLSSFVLPPVIINYCFIADKLHLEYLNMVKKEMSNLTSSINDKSKKEIIDKIINDINKHQNDSNDKEN